ncbi:pyrroline-5-carboxylate reductase [Emcibacter nanhaiensis]|uniref:Pyrroline-5-carboxylate reductase n=1 Tax=Emcibacter nanhaiensis TaxID=1505037 RepID=A0A501PGU6_9PROT|nr:pyrroline-5-carboxylate reductase [Emcibacter nanhaiensis]TPD59425.1 pyrroline-5-carboxylate reductase [Emcibacter nanhaiensis]
MSDLSRITSQHPLLLIGCGKMGGAMLQGWLGQGLSSDAVWVVDPHLEPARNMVPELDPCAFVENAADLPDGTTPSFVVLAVKPQMMDDAVGQLGELELSESLLLSIAAGKTLSWFESRLGADKAIVRAMPNTPAAIGMGITVGCANSLVSESQKETCTALLSAVGEVDWVEKEGLIDAVTAVSGSGPAYVFHLVEAMASAGERVGLEPDLAMKLALRTVIGAGALLDQSSESASQLRINVTSPNGTTQAALDVLMGEEGLGKLMARAIRAAYDRSRELAD